MRAPGPEFLEASQAPSGAAREFLAALGARIGHSAGAGPAPDRLIVVVDNLDALSPTAAINWIDAAQGVIGAGSIGLLAFDPGRLSAALGDPSEARRRLGKWLQVAGQPAGPQGRRRRTRGCPPSVGGGSKRRQRWTLRSPPRFVEPLSAKETALLAALAPLAAHSPRDAKRFLNAYRLARCSTSPRAVMALMQAVAFADDDAQAAMRDRLTYGSGELTDLTGPPALVDAVRAARVGNNGSISIDEARGAAGNHCPLRAATLEKRQSLRRVGHRRGAGAQIVPAPQAR